MAVEKSGDERLAPVVGEFGDGKFCGAPLRVTVTTR
jgi:hypothetical protein